MNILEWLKAKREQPDAERRLSEIRDSYRRVFSGQAGREVLTHLLSELHFFDEVVTKEELALSNFARRLLYYVGPWDHRNLEDTSLVAALLSIPMKDDVGSLRSDKGVNMIQVEETQ